MAAAVLLVAAASWSLRWPGALFDRKTASPRNDPEGAGPELKEMVKLIRRAGVEFAKADEEDRKKVIPAFFQCLSHARFKEHLNSSHPDLAFVKRLPDKATEVPDLREALASLHDGLYESLYDKKPARTDHELPLSKLVQKIGELLDYDTWWEKKGHLLPCPCTDEVPAVHAFVRHFARKPAEGDWRLEPAKKMLVGLTGWGTKGVTREDAEARPLFVFQCFFSVLSREDLGQVSAEDWSQKHPYVVFLKRLPREPLTRKIPIKVEEDLENALKELEVCLRPGRDAPEDRISAIIHAMNYLDWRRGAVAKRFPDEGKAVHPAIDRCMQERFNRPSAETEGKQDD
jgi:hypothetical protein